MPSFKRPANPSYLRRAIFAMFDPRCLNCGDGGPLDMAHILGWPECVASAGRRIRGVEPPQDWHYAVAVDSFHNVRNVVPLCPTCHRRLDGERYLDVTKCAIQQLRDEAARRPEVLERAIDFVGTELAGRPNRCQHRGANGKRMHAYVIDTTAAAMALPWIVDAYRAGRLTEAPEMIVENGRGWHHHVRLDHGSISACSGVLDACSANAPVWTPKPRR